MKIILNYNDLTEAIQDYVQKRMYSTHPMLVEGFDITENEDTSISANIRIEVRTKGYWEREGR